MRLGKLLFCSERQLEVGQLTEVHGDGVMEGEAERSKGSCCSDVTATWLIKWQSSMQGKVIQNSLNEVKVSTILKPLIFLPPL